jgi:hypothetical protein
LTQPKAPPASDPSALVRRHLRAGWWTLLVFLTLGIALEALHGFKVQWYLNVANETRRLMLTLAHAHGVLVGLVHLAFAATLRTLGPERAGGLERASLCLLAATFLLPGGFLLGGIVVYGGDPGRGILLVPVGALLLFLGVLMTALRVTRR